MFLGLEFNQRKKGQDTNSMTWNNLIPFKCSFQLWRTLRGKLPTNEKITSFGQQPADCYCCNVAGSDTIDHIFVDGNFAKYIWSFFADWFVIAKATSH